MGFSKPLSFFPIAQPFRDARRAFSSISSILLAPKYYDCRGSGGANVHVIDRKKKKNPQRGEEERGGGGEVEAGRSPALHE